MKVWLRDIKISHLEGSYFEATFPDRESPFVDEEYYVLFFVTYKDELQILHIYNSFEGVTLKIEDEKTEKEVRRVLKRYLAAHMAELDEKASA